MNERDEELVRMLALRRVPGMGWKRLRVALSEYGSSEILWEELAQSSSAKLTWWQEAEREFELAHRKQIHLLLFDDIDYPDNLKCLDDSPLILYQWGKKLEHAQRAIAVVGSRKCSAYGEEVTRRLVEELVGQGFTIVSGMARGIDSVAHQAAVERGGQTIAVCGYGLDHGVPSQSRRLAELIREHGQLISAFDLEVAAQPYTFAMRNSLIAGLSLAVVVTEAGVDSGSLLTAGWAKTYKRPVLAVPGSIFSSGSQGTHRLIKLGANLAVDAADIVDKLGEQFVDPSPAQAQSTSDKLAQFDLTASQTQIVDVLLQTPQSIDDLIRRCRQPAADVSVAVMELELMGVVGRMGDEVVLLRK